MEDKHGKGSAPFKKNEASQKVEDDAGDSDESSSEEEDDQGLLATPALDSEIMATLNAIRSKDPRVYDGETTFYSQIEEAPDETTESSKEKPMYLRDYHREKLLSGANGDEDEEEAPRTFAQEQEELKQSVIKEMHSKAGESEGSDDDDEKEDDGGFLIPKKAPEPVGKEVELDIETADKDPETFLSNFMASRAWVPNQKARFQPLESDDEEEDQSAEAFEQAYNLRFEDPNTVNEKLTTHARDTSSKFSVRRDEPNSRKKRREAESSKKEEEKKNRDLEKARLRKLRIEELEGKVKKIKQAAGIKSSDIVDEDWARLLEDGFDVDKWEQEMQKRFGNEYYEEAEAVSSDAEDGSHKKRKLKKPKWDDDIDIKDLVPDYEDDEEPNLNQSDMDESADGMEGTKKKKKKDHVQEKRDKKREARKDRRKIEEIVDKNLDLDASLLPGSSKHAGHFRYRETSPTNYGLTPRDILMADDTQLNQFVGLKKLATFRDPETKRRDQKKMGKKARLRQWRKDTFGDEQGPKVPEAEPDLLGPLEDSLNAPGGESSGKVDIREGKKKRKRSKKKQSSNENS